MLLKTSYFFLQEAEAEKNLHLTQAEEVMKKKAVVDDKQKVLQNQLNDIRDQLNQYQEKRNVIGVCDISSFLLCDVSSSALILYRKRSKTLLRSGSRHRTT